MVWDGVKTKGGPGNSAFVTFFLDGDGYVTRTQRVVGDLQRLGIKRSRIE